MKKHVKIIALMVLSTFPFSSLAYPLEIRVLSDHELDQVYAGGLNLDFDKFLGSFSSATDTVSKGGVSDVSAAVNRPIVFDRNDKTVKIVEIKAPTLPQKPNVPLTPKVPVTPNTSDVPDLPDLPDLPDVPCTPVPDINVMTESVDMTPVPADANTAVLSESAMSDASDMSLAGITTSDMSVLPSGIDGNPEASRVLSPADPVAPVSPVSPAQPVSPATPRAPVAPAMRFDVVAGQNNGKFAVAVSDQSSGVSADAPVFTASNLGGQNYLNVTDTAQQSLQALVNVNAAGSVVPVQLNLTVLINSHVENMNLANQLDLQNFSTYQF